MSWIAAERAVASALKQQRMTAAEFLAWAAGQALKQATDGRWVLHPSAAGEGRQLARVDLATWRPGDLAISAEALWADLEPAA